MREDDDCTAVGVKREIRFTRDFRGDDLAALPVLAIPEKEVLVVFGFGAPRVLHKPPRTRAERSSQSHRLARSIASRYLEDPRSSDPNPTRTPGRVPPRRVSSSISKMRGVFP